MKHVKMMMLSTCPHCKKAFEMLDELKKEHPEYRDVEIEVIDEQQEEEKTKGYDYWYVPTFFVDDQKLHEGVPSIAAIEAVLKAAIE